MREKKGEMGMQTGKEITKKMQEIKDVRPIKDEKQIEDFTYFLNRRIEQAQTPNAKQTAWRNYMLFYLGINVGLRISDLLNIKAEQVRGKKEATVREGKTGKTRKIYIPVDVQKELNAYIDTLDLSKNEYLFPSRQVSRKGISNKPIGRTQAWGAFDSVAKEAGIEYIGTHTLRKTYGYQFYTKNAEIGKGNQALTKLQKIFNHTSSQVTLDYIGITDQEIEESLEGFHLGGKKRL